MFRRRASAALLALLAACSSRPAAADFSLVSDTGKAWRMSDQHTIVLLTFGFSHCPDTCPALLARLSRIARADTHGQPVQIAMVSIDPQRDRPRALHAFVSRFAGVTGLTGTQEQIDAVETAYHVWAQRLPLKHGGYDYAHVTEVYVIDARGRVAAIRDDSDSDAAIASAIARATAS
jgi:protein SCO1